MIRANFYPAKSLYGKPAFWGFDRDLKEVIESMENVWQRPAVKVNTNYKENETAYYMSIDVPGLNRNTLEINVEGEALVIQGVRKKGVLPGEEVEIKLSQKFLLPDQVDTEKIEAHIEDGVLYLALPKIKKAEPKKIEITGT